MSYFIQITEKFEMKQKLITLIKFIVIINKQKHKDISIIVILPHECHKIKIQI